MRYYCFLTSIKKQVKQIFFSHTLFSDLGCYKITNMSNFVSIGKLSFSRDSFKKGSFGKVFLGRFEDLVDVSIAKVDKSEFNVDKQVLRTTDMHPNIIRFYTIEDDSDNEFQ